MNISIEDMDSIDAWIDVHASPSPMWVPLVEAWKRMSGEVRSRTVRVGNGALRFKNEEEFHAVNASCAAATGTLLFLTQDAWGPEFEVALHVNVDSAQALVFELSPESDHVREVWDSGFRPRAGVVLLECLMASDSVVLWGASGRR